MMIGTCHSLGNGFRSNGRRRRLVWLTALSVLTFIFSIDVDVVQCRPYHYGLAKYGYPGDYNDINNRDADGEKEDSQVQYDLSGLKDEEAEAEEELHLPKLEQGNEHEQSDKYYEQLGRLVAHQMAQKVVNNYRHKQSMKKDKKEDGKDTKNEDTNNKVVPSSVNIPTTVITVTSTTVPTTTASTVTSTVPSTSTSAKAQQPTVPLASETPPVGHQTSADAEWNQNEPGGGTPDSNDAQQVPTSATTEDEDGEGLSFGEWFVILMLILLLVAACFLGGLYTNCLRPTPLIGDKSKDSKNANVASKVPSFNLSQYMASKSGGKSDNNKQGASSSSSSSDGGKVPSTDTAQSLSVAGATPASDDKSKSISSTLSSSTSGASSTLTPSSSSSNSNNSNNSNTSTTPGALSAIAPPKQVFLSQLPSAKVKEGIAMGVQSKQP